MNTQHTSGKGWHYQDLSEDSLAKQAMDWFDAHRDEYIAMLKEFIAVPSVSEEDEGEPGKPYGQGVADVFDLMRAKAADYGFESHDYEGYAIGVEYGHGLAKDDPKRKDIALVGHLDVVPAGDGWDSGPWEPYDRDGYVIGRGSSDNKSTCVADLFLLRFYKERGIEFKHDLRLLFGGAEETGLDDMRQFVASHGAPYQAIITDGPFPVNNAQHGSLNAKAWVPVAADGVFAGFHAGVAGNVIPGEAGVSLPGLTVDEARKALDAIPAEALHGGELRVEEAEGSVCVTGVGVSGHSGFPEGSLNAILVLMGALHASGLLHGEDDALAAAFEQWLTHDIGVAYEDEPSGATTTCIGLVSPADGGLELDIDVRYAVTQRSKDIMAGLEATFGALGGHVRLDRDFAPYYVPAEDPRVRLLLDNYDDVLNLKGSVICMGGGTHARVIPGALNYGPGFGEDKELLQQLGWVAYPPEFIPSRKGSFHQADEWMNVDEMRSVFGIYAQMLPRMDQLLTEHPEYALSQSQEA